MKTLNKVTWKNLWMNQKRTILTIVSVMLACIFIFCIGFAGATYRESEIKSASREVGRAHAYYEDYPYEKIEILKNSDKIGKIWTVKQLFEGNIEPFSGQTFSIGVTVNGVLSEYLSEVHLKSGKIPENEHQLIVDPAFFAYGKYQLNDIVKIDETEYQIVGVFDDLPDHKGYQDNFSIKGKHLLYTKYDALIEENVTFGVLFQNPKTAHDDGYDISKALGHPCTFVYNDVLCKNLQFNDRLLAMYGDVLDYGGFAVLFLFVFLSMVISAFFCIFVIYNAFAISVQERKKLFGTFSSLGATPRQIFRTVFFEASIVALIGIPLGFLFSIGIFESLLWLVNSLLHNLLPYPLTSSFYPLFIILPVVILIITIFLSAFFPAKRASEVAPMDAIRKTGDIKIGKLFKKPFFLTTKLFGIEGEMASKNMKRNRKKYRITTISIVLSVVLFLTVSTFLNIYIRGINEGIMSLNYDIVMSIQDQDEKKIVDFNRQLHQNEYVKDIVIYHSELFVTSLPNDVYDIKFYEHCIGKNDYYNPDKVMVILNVLEQKTYENYQKQLGLQQDVPILVNLFQTDPIDSIFNPGCSDIGTEEQLKKGVLMWRESADVAFSIKRSESASEVYHLNDFFYAKEVPIGFQMRQISPVIFVSEERYQEIIATTGVEDSTKQDLRYGYYLTTDDWRQFEKKLFADSPSKTLDFEQYYYENQIAPIEEQNQTLFSIRAVLYLIIGFVILIAVTSILATVKASMDLRKREFIMLRSIGMTSKQFNKMIFLESVFFSMKALIYSLLLSTGSIYLIYRMIKFQTELGGTTKYHIQQFPWPWGYVMISIIGVFVIVLITMLYSTKKIKKQNIADVLKEEIDA